MPCYRSEMFISDMIKDVIDQTYTNWELIIVSNGKDQEAQLDIIREFSSKDNRIRLFSIDEAGVSNARNIGMQFATGNWLTFIDADDRLKNIHLSSLSEGVKDETDIVIGGFSEHISGRTERVSIPAPELSCIDKKFIEMFDGLKRSPWNKLLRVTTLRNWGGVFDINLTINEDALFFYSLYCHTQNITSVPMSGYIYNFGNSGSALSKYHNCYELSEQLVLKYEKEMICLADTDDEWKHLQFNRAQYFSSYFSICNFFKGKKVLPYRVLKDKIKRTLGNSEVKSAVISRKGSPCNINLKIFNFCVLHNTPYTLYLIFTARKLWKKFSKKG